MRLVTGGGSGIGAAIALALRGGRRGRVASPAGATQPLEAVGRGLPRATAIVADVTSEADCAAMAEAARAAHGPVDIVVANAGARRKRAGRQDRRWRTGSASMDVNLTGAFLTVQRGAARRHARGRGGRPAASSSSPRPRPARATPMSRPMRGQARRRRPDARAGGGARAERRHGERRLPRLSSRRRCSMPRWRRSSPRPAAAAEEARAALARPIRSGRFIKPEEVAQTVLWLCSPAADRRHRPGHLGLGGQTSRECRRRARRSAQQGAAAAVDPAAARLARHRGRAARAAARRVRHHAAAVRRDGGAWRAPRPA